MKRQLKEVGIFPSPCESGHNFQLVRDSREDNEGNKINGYYKRDARNNPIDANVYAMLFCTKCGATKEISIVNRRK